MTTNNQYYNQEYNCQTISYLIWTIAEISGGAPAVLQSTVSSVTHVLNIILTNFGDKIVLMIENFAHLENVENIATSVYNSVSSSLSWRNIFSKHIEHLSRLSNFQTWVTHTTLTNNLQGYLKSK